MVENMCGFVLNLDTKSRIFTMVQTSKLAMSLLLFSVTFASSLTLKHCRTNSDCLGNEYCYSGSNYCTPCLDCSQHNQQNPTGCAKDPKDCGDCLPGYQQDPNNQFHNGRKRCATSITGHETLTESNNYIPEKQFNTWYLLFGFFPVVFIVGLTLWCYLKKCRRRCQIPEKPPINDPSAPMMEPEPYPPAYTPLPSTSTNPFQPSIGPRISDRVQETRPFRPPNYVVPPSVTEDHTDSVANDNINPADGENTQPSSWTPTASAGDRTTFAGILQSGNRNVRRHSETENIQEQDQPPPKQSNNSDEPRYTLNFNNIINIDNTTLQTQTQTNLHPANTANMNCFYSRNVESPDEQDEELENISEDRQLRRYRNN